MIMRARTQNVAAAVEDVVVVAAAVVVAVVAAAIAVGFECPDTNTNMTGVRYAHPHTHSADGRPKIRIDSQIIQNYRGGTQRNNKSREF